MARECGTNKRLAAGLRAGIATAVAAAAIATSPIALSSRAFAQSNAQASFNIPAGPLNQTLALFGSQSGTQLSYEASIASGKTTSGASGAISREHALDQILRGTGLTYRFTGPHTVLISQPASSAGTILPDGSTVLEQIVIQGQGESAWGPADGLIARQSATGTKTDTPILETPQSISVISRAQLEQQGVQTVQGAVRYTPGVTADQQGPDTRRDYIMSRGFRSEVFQDGLRGPFAGIYTDARSEAYGLERVEVLRGPSSVLFGQNPPGGIVNLVSKRPTSEPLREVQIQTGSYGRAQTAFDFSGPIDEDGEFLYRLTGLGRLSDTQVDHVGDDRLFIAPAFTWKPDDDTTLTILGQYSHDKGGTVPQYLPALGTLYSNPNGAIPRNRFVGEPGFDGFERDFYSVGYNFEHRFDETFTFRQNLKYSKVDYTNNGYIFGLGLDNDLRTLRRFGGAGYRDTGVFGVDNQLEAKFDTGGLAHTLLFGLDYAKVNMDTALWSISQPAIDVYNPVYGSWNTSPSWTFGQKQSQNLTGVYLQDQVSLDKWRFTLSGRHDWADSRTTNKLSQEVTTTDDTAFTGRVGVNYLFDNGVTPYVSYATSFEPVSGTGWDGSPFKPTEGAQFEAGIKYEPVGFNGFFAVSAFQLDQQNVVTADLAHDCGSWNDPRCGSFDTQTGEVRVRGVEFEAKVGVTDDFDLIGSYTYLDARITKSNYSDEVGKTPTDTPTHQASLWGDYRVTEGAFAGLSVGAGVRYVGSRYGTSNNELDLPLYGTVSSKIPAVTLVDAAIRYDFGKLQPELDGLTLAVNATNLFNEKHVAGCQSERTCFYGPGRTVFATLNYRW
ncbi:TonB-dependent siderophore receptor [Tianweitania populi]|uniref:TonB-dependent receptor n=1 Tax=Tianweitania populi TaxID=1607949 RepID=A0A8J3DZD5_9HYPH|nr:TonB-dependent siderophore receptor [Tianweitania populi]GHD23756.1 TonB-dependent receptor [Tianweitania populi]